MVEEPVRSGQSVIFIEGDVTVLGSVGSGAEIVAGEIDSTFTGPFAAARWQAPQVMPVRASFATASRPSFLRSTPTTERLTTLTTACAADLLRLGLKATRCKFRQ